MDHPARAGRADPDGSPLDSTFHLGLPVWELVARGVLIYAALLIALRVFGKREVGQFTVYDLVFVLLVANALQPAMTGPDASVTGGVILIVALVLTNVVVGRLADVPALHRFFVPPPAVIYDDGRYMLRTMRREGITRDEIEMAAREHGLKDMKEVDRAVLEEDGSISIVGGTSRQRPKRRGRFNRRQN
ncbi:MAG TPA: YetF domain-containing protein [Candidatus Dormibacteraeota bacterium]|nr:YetF domain-containing protein [Candidatus Dormibacteraeota bacterium]